jgi:hypothetical protein
MTYTDPQDPRPERVVEVRRDSNAGWLVAGAVAVVAVIAVAFMVMQRPDGPTQDQILQAQEQGRAVGVLEGAQTGMSVGAQQAQMAAESAARDANAAADAARRSTEQSADAAAASARDAARDASARIDASPSAQGATSPESVPQPQ